MATAELPNGLRARAHRDGMFVFDFATWAPLPPGDVPDFGAVAEVVLRRVTLMNAHLACLYTAVISGPRYSTDPTALTPDQILPMNDFDNQGGGVGLPDARIAHIHMARYRSSYPSQMPLQMDYRLSRTFTLGADQVDESFRLLQDLLTHSASAEVLPLAELLLRSAVALSRHDYSISLVLAWAVTEALLGELWERYLDDTKSRPGDGEHPFMPRKRMERLSDGPDMTASLTIEMLSLLEQIAFPLYLRLNDVRGARNKWIHDLRPVVAASAITAMGVAEEMLELVHAVSLALPRSLHLQT